MGGLRGRARYKRFNNLFAPYRKIGAIQIFVNGLQIRLLNGKSTYFRQSLEYISVIDVSSSSL